jgi:hypothetical protein
VAHSKRIGKYNNFLRLCPQWLGKDGTEQHAGDGE